MVACSGDLLGVQSIGNSHFPFSVVECVDDHIELVCEAPLEIERLRIASVVLDRHGIVHLRIRLRVDGLIVVKEILVQSRLVRKIQTETRTYRGVVHQKAVRVALRGGDMPPERQRCKVAVHFDE